MATNTREVVEGAQVQGEDESIRYSVDWSALGGQESALPSSPVVVVKVEGSDVTTAVMPVNAPIISGSEVILSPLLGLTAGLVYRVEVRVNIGSNVLESYFMVTAQV
ncbi:protein of unknown function [Candidatus Promineifilum breve]|uniref:Uncharacterized protein n=1 Tax=Candidatus Promineifilum breve TaxID=1806508 RepID=A0A161K3R1_9CHLR|nr:hypothetical protein [Candidatus Promineifilum breve]CUS05397.2 protein of unknown function [Candidatus Promineifilum breve]